VRVLTKPTSCLELSVIMLAVFLVNLGSGAEWVSCYDGEIVADPGRYR
jgi:hypothetical protein